MKHAQTTEFETYSGALVDLLDPRAADICMTDVVMSLSKVCRFTGHPKRHYSVAQHSCIVANLLPEEHRIHGLAHDMPEFGMGDLSSPMKRVLERLPGFHQLWHDIERGIERAIYERMGVDLPTREVREMVKRADLEVLAIEQRDAMRSPNRWNLRYPPPDDRRIVPVPADAAFMMLAEALHECGVSLDGPPMRLTF